MKPQTFEECFAGLGYDFKKTTGGNYADQVTFYAYVGWQAAHENAARVCETEPYHGDNAAESYAEYIRAHSKATTTHHPV